ncbi:MAG TPA: MFS transporter [Chloroflexota bacterium]|jgi:EmrB/QacA subfamily drug resistance transporter|nr:MFS transporter [Chloroflexota bacterium]
MATTTQPTGPAASTWSGQQTTSGAHKWWALAAACFGLFMTLLDITIVNVALPSISSDLHANFADLQWVINAYTIALAVFLVTVGRLGDIFGRKRMFMIGLGIFTLGSLLCALSSTISIGGISHTGFLFGARAIQGFGGSFMLPLSLAIITATFAGHERGTAIGIWGGVTGLATAIGPVVGGVLVQTAGWQSIFLLNVPIGIIGIGLSAWAIRESRDERAPRVIDFFGLVTSAVFVLCLVLALVQGNDPDKGWTSGYILTLFGVAIVAFIAFVVGELRLKYPMADPRLFKIPSFAGSAIIAFVLSAGFYALLFFLTLYLQNTLRFDALQAGLRFLTLSALILVGAPLAGRLTDRIGPKPILMFSTALLIISVLLMTRISSSSFDQTQWLALLPAFLIGGIASGMINPPISTLAVGTVDRRVAGMASGISGLCRQIGTAFGIAFLGAVLTGRYNSYIHDRIMALQAPGITPAIKQNMIKGIQNAGDLAGSAGLKGGGAQPNPYAHTRLFPTLSHIARASFVDGTIDILRIAAVMVAVGFLASVFLVRRSDLRYGEGAPPAAAA